MIENRALDALHEVLSGELVLPDDPRYDEARKVFNAMIDKRPAVIARCATTADVAAAVNFAREQRLVVAVRSGGHSVAGLSVCEGGIADRPRRLEADRRRSRPRRPRGPAAAFSGASSMPRRRSTGCTRPAVASRRPASAASPPAAATAGPPPSTASPATTCSPPRSCSPTAASSPPASSENADLFWGIRGGGGNFGIVTEFEFRLHQLGPIVLAGLALWPIERAARGHARLARLCRQRARRALDGVRDRDGAA